MRLLIFVTLVLFVGLIYFPQNSFAQLDTPYDPDFFFNGFSDECHTPCWYDMKVGETTQKEFLNIFESMPSFMGVLPDGTAGWSNAPYNGWIVGQMYTFENQPSGAVTFIRGYTLNNILQGLVIDILGLAIIDISPQRVVEKLGSPSEYLFYISKVYAN